MFVKPRQVVAVTTKDGTTHQIQPGTYWTMTGAYGEPWVSFTTTTGEAFTGPAHHIRRVVHDDDGEHGNMGFA